MKSRITITLRIFPVTVEDPSSGVLKEDHIVIAKSYLQAAELIGVRTDELISRHYNKAGFRVLEIRKPAKKTATIIFNERGELVHE